MDCANENPPSNTLRPGITDEALTHAIKTSGYPLQLQVANLLAASFSLQEEWSYPDSDSQAIRTIDIVATRYHEWSAPQPRAWPAVSLVVECKQSELPYVFFLSETKQWLTDFPLIGGLKSDVVVITSDDDPSSWSYGPLSLFDLHRHPFLTDVASCMTFSKCVRKGKELELSGSDAYHGIVFPITQAIKHLQAFNAPPITAYYFDCILIIGLAVIDAPMVTVRLTGGEPRIQLVPWVRVLRHHPKSGAHKSDRGETLGIEIVHKDFLPTYLDKHVLPFADQFAELVLKHHKVLADARAFVSGMGQDSWNNIEQRLRTTSFITKRKRGKAVLNNILSALRTAKRP